MRRDEHEVYFGIKDVRKEKILKAYDISWLEEIEDKVLNFTHNKTKEMLNLLKKMPDFEKQVEKEAVEGYGIPVESRGGHHRVFHKTTQGAGAVKKLESTGMPTDALQKVT